MGKAKATQVSKAVNLPPEEDARVSAAVGARERERASGELVELAAAGAT